MKNLSIVSLILVLSLSFLGDATAQVNTTYMRMAKIVVDSSQLENYISALTEQMESAVTSENGVLAYTAVQEKNNPTHITIIETYASLAAYQAHIQTVHFKKYKATVENMVQKLALTDLVPIAMKTNRKTKN